MKTYLPIILVCMGFKSFSQTPAEKSLIQLSSTIFRWEVDSKFDSLEKVFNDKFVVVGSDGNSQFKKEYIHRLRSNAFIHDSIRVEQSSAMVSGNTAILIGKGKFSVRVSGKRMDLHLSYMEVFTRPGSKKPWQVIAMKANPI